MENHVHPIEQNIPIRVQQILLEETEPGAVLKDGQVAFLDPAGVIVEK